MFPVVGRLTAIVFVILIVPNFGASQSATSGQDQNGQLTTALDLLKESQAEQKRLLEELSKKIAEPKKNPWTETTTWVPLLIATGGWVFAAHQAYQTKKAQRDLQQSQATEARTARLEQHVFDSLEWFSGKTQRRSIGIAVVKANWDEFEQFQPTWLSLLVSQAIYLLTESESHQKSHELANLKNIMDRLLANSNKLHQSDRQDLKTAIDDNRNNRKKNGLKNVEPDTLDDWENAL